MRHVPGAVDVHVQQLMNNPDAAPGCGSRTRASRWASRERDVAQNLLVSLSSSFQTAPTFWLNPKNGVSYNVAVQSPQYRVDSLQALDEHADQRRRRRRRRRCWRTWRRSRP